MLLHINTYTPLVLDHSYEHLIETGPKDIEIDKVLVV
jgi:hypothetical protein